MTDKLVYTHPSIVAVTQAASTLEQVGIAAKVQNQYAAGAIGELAPIDAWPELWVEGKDWARAQDALERATQAGHSPEWRCSKCNNSNPGSFDFCWHCGTDRA
ncbi:MAG: DUF2007 domain-containing protein [Pseudomonadota bacterium]